MGIDGLLAFLKPLTRKTHISQFKNKTIGVDILPWLYKGCYSNVMSMNEQDLENQYKQNENGSCANYLLQMLSMLQENQVKIIAVYDGRMLNMKGQTVKKRKQIRQKYGKIGQQKMQQNNNKQARKHLARSIRVSQNIILQSMRILKTKNIPFIVSPYQSDSQLAKLKKLKIIDAVISQDSDLIVYGCNVLFKLDEQGMCNYLDLYSYKPTDLTQEQLKCAGLKQFLSMGQFQRIIVCVLAGCDYVQSIKGIGIKKAIKIVVNQPDITQILNKLKVDKIFGERIQPRYQEKVYKAITIFNHALVFNPIEMRLQPLTTTNKPILIQPQFLLQTIGIPYQQYFSLNIYLGQTTSRTLQPRNITLIQLMKQQEAQITTLGNLKQKLMQNGFTDESDGNDSLLHFIF